MNADQSGHRQQTLPGGAHSWLVRGFGRDGQLLPPSQQMLADITVESAGRPGVRGKCRQGGGGILAAIPPA